jgi:hypothetical protein
MNHLFQTNIGISSFVLRISCYSGQGGSDESRYGQMFRM